LGNQIRKAASITAASVVLLAALHTPVYPQQLARSQSAEAFEFAVIGDTGYALNQEPLVDNLLAEINGRLLEFVVHVGDFGGPSAGSCTDERRSVRLAQFQASAHPLIYTPGDNDWTDCWEERAGSYDALDRLRSLRETFFAGERSLGTRTVPLNRQSNQVGYATFRENVRWTHGGVTFLTLHYVTEVLGRTFETDAEFAERNAANLVWLRDGFLAARSANSRGIVILTQANPTPTYAGGRGVAPEPRAGFNEFWSLLQDETIAFGKPVLLVHGDTHYFRVDYPLHSSAPECQSGTHDVRPIYCRIHNLTRVEVFGAPYHHWVQVTVDPNDPSVFTVRPRLVEANLPAQP
jgi:hypothetical protein